MSSSVGRPLGLHLGVSGIKHRVSHIPGMRFTPLSYLSGPQILLCFYIVEALTSVQLVGHAEERVA